MAWHRKSHWQILIALAMAVVAGISLKAFAPEAAADGAFIETCRVLGELFMRALKMIIVPIVLVSIICGIGGVGAVHGFGRLGLKTLAFYTTSTLLAATAGLLVVNTIQPGLENGQPNPVVREAIASEAERMGGSGQSSEVARKVEESQPGVAATLKNLLLRMIPTNVIESAAATDMLGLIFFALLFGIALASIDSPQVVALREVFHGLNAIILKITGWVMACAPIGVFALVTPVVAGTGGAIFKALGMYFVTVLAALSIHMFLVLPALLILLGRLSPRRHFAAVRDALLTAFSTASSNATLPVTLRCLQQNAGVSPRVAGFTLPLGATVNMDGTALYECVAVIFVAQVLGVELSLATQLTVVLLALLTSIGVAGVPSASLVAIVIILQSVQIEGAGAAIAVLISVDRLLDMSRTAVNVFGDTCGAVVIAKSEGEKVLGS